ncbi:hypothetical protein AALO_G00183790, partial [Alosa alosa]
CVCLCKGRDQQLRGRTSGQVGLASRVVPVVPILIIAAQQVVDGQVHVQVGALQLSDDHAARLPLQNHLGLEMSSSGMTEAGMTGWGWLPRRPEPRSRPVRMTRVCRRESLAA